MKKISLKLSFLLIISNLLGVILIAISFLLHVDHIFIKGKPHIQISELVVSVFISIIIICIISFITTFIISKIIGKPIQCVTRLLDYISKFDLSKDFIDKNVLDRKDELGNMSRSLNNLKNNLMFVGKGIKESSENISDSVLSLSDDINVSEKSMENISKAMEELSKGAVELAENTQSSFEKLEELSKKIIFTRGEGINLQQCSKENRTIMRKSTEQLCEVEDKFNESTRNIRETSKFIDDLWKKSEDIEGITRTIEDISMRTDLLSLNATIEAAKAKENGKGFSVIAEEIRLLSQKTKNATDVIGEILGELKEEIKFSKENMDKCILINEENNSALKIERSYSNKLQKSYSNSVKTLDNLIQNMDKMNEDRDVVLEALQEISAVSEETAAATEEVFSIIQDQLQSIESIGQSSSYLKSISKVLDNITNKIKLE